MSRTVVIAVVAILALLCCCIFVLIAIGGLAAYVAANATGVAPIFTPIGTTSTPTPKPVLMLTPLPTPLPNAGDTLSVLESETVPEGDLRELAMRLKDIPDIPVTVSDTPTDYPIGQELEFNVSNSDTNETFPVTARLVYKTKNVYFFVEDGVEVDTSDVKTLVDEFQDKTYPTDREFFGEEWNPGVDGDPRLYILFSRGLGTNVGGYYSSTDEYSKLAHEYSNEKEMFYLNAESVPLSDEYWPGTLAHEFQHMIHWYHDRNEESWMNEGASELAALLNGYDPGGSDFSFVAQPDLQLNTWVDSGSPEFSPHYGSAFLFMTYFLDRFGSQATQALVADPANGLRAVDDVLAAQGLTDPANGQPLTAVDVFADWVIANYLGDPSVADGRYAYHNYTNAPKVSDPTDTFSDCPLTQAATVHQFAADYYEIKCDGPVTINFAGSLQVQVIPGQPHSGRYAFWGNRSDESDTTLTRAFDLSGLSSATLTYSMWAQIEKDFDYAYLEVSTDGGTTWKILRTPSGTDEDPTGANLDWGYTGNSGGGDPENGDPSKWIQETVDLSEYAGQKILIRFEYVTDAALNYAGFMLDDISIPELHYSADLENDDGGWDGMGFVRMDNLLPQTFVVQVIRQGTQTTVERLPLDARNQGSLTLDLAQNESATLVVSGTTPFTTEVASYQFEVR